MGSKWFVYLLRGRERRFYCGITTDLERRIWEHNNDPARASKAMRTRTVNRRRA